MESKLQAYPSLPVTMYGSAVSIWLSNDKVKQYKPFLPKEININENNEIRLRIWDLKMDSSEAKLNLSNNLISYGFREGVLAIPSKKDDIEGEYPLHMYSDSFLYTALARETIGWNVKQGEVISNIEDELKRGQNIESSLNTEWNFKLSLLVKNIFLQEEKVLLPKGTWFAKKIVASPYDKKNYSEELIIGGSSEIKVEKIWSGEGDFKLFDGFLDLQLNSEDSKINKVEIWENLKMSVGYANK